MKVLIIGGVDHLDSDRRVVPLLNDLHNTVGVEAVIYTGSVGASKHALEWVSAKGSRMIEKRPTHIRVDPSMFSGAVNFNKEKGIHMDQHQLKKACCKVHKSMIEDHHPDLVIAFSGDNTQSVINRAYAAKIPVMELV